MRHARTAALSLVPAALGLGVVLLLGGCMRTTSGGGLGGYSYRMGELRSELTESLDRTYHAAVAAVDQSRLIIRQEERAEGSVHLMAERADGTHVKVRIQRLSPSLTEVRVKVGILGNEPQSQTILDNIRYALATAP